ncbi:hypothetical protein Psch_00780 [Pelotomaculum schinkii]|uniref:Uncharacterized protein n=1 Tax=Pelotomaculum schinkii TaxID=78350 RepID=A0A4Y7REM4_9FIRM|nr:hypothetical protein [Pelotomaculum schinkii]TEB07233.1 hypothetical protein Psch_00780 [Pelotomaculum schinkii]
MSCYLRHLKPVLGELGIEPKTKEERKQIDLAIRSIVGKSNTDRCGEVWQEVKVRLQDDMKKRSLLDALKNLA